MGRKIKVGLMVLLVIAVITATASAQDITRTINPKEVLPGETVTVDLSTTRDLRAVTIYENFPGTLDNYTCTGCDNVTYDETSGAFIVVDLAGGGFTVTYTITAPDPPGTYAFSGTYEDAWSDVSGNVIGDNNITVVLGDIIITPLQQLYADGKLYNMQLRIYNDTYGIIPWSGQVNLTFNTSNAWINNGSATFQQTAIVNVVNGIANFSVGAFNNCSNVTAELTAEPIGTAFIKSNSTVINFWAPPQTALITGDYRKAEGGLLNESEVGGVRITVVNSVTGITLYSFVDNVSDCGYTLKVPLGSYTVTGQAKYYSAATSTVVVNQPDVTFTADLAFVSNRVPSQIYMVYGHYTNTTQVKNDYLSGINVARTNVADGSENTAEEVTVVVLDQYNDPITADVQITIQAPGDLQKDGGYTRTITLTANDGIAYFYVTSYGANQSVAPIYAPMTTVNVTAIIISNLTATPAVITKTYVWKGNSSVMGQVYYVDEKNGIKGPAVNATVWAVYADMSNQSLAYIENVMPWMVDTTDENGMYVLDGIAAPAQIFIYVVYEGWNGVNDTINAPSLASQGELDPAFEMLRSGRTNMHIAAAEYETIRADGDTENHDIKLDNPEPIGFIINMSETKHTLVYNDVATITVNLSWFPKSDPGDLHPANNVVVDVRLIPNSTNNVLGCLLDNGTVQATNVNVKIVNGSGTLKFISGGRAGVVDINVSYTYYDLELQRNVTISKRDYKTIIDVARVSGDITDKSGTQLSDPAKNRQLIVALWYDADGDRTLNTSVDKLVVAENNGEIASSAITGQEVSAMAIVNAIYGTIQTWTNQPVNISPYNPRFSDQTFGHYSFFNVSTGFNYIVEVIWLARPPADTQDAIAQINSGNYSVSLVPFFIQPGAGTVTHDVALEKPQGYMEYSSPSPTELKEKLKQEILSKINQYVTNPSDELKQEILDLIKQYLLQSIV